MRNGLVTADAVSFPIWITRMATRTAVQVVVHLAVDKSSPFFFAFLYSSASLMLTQSFALNVILTFL